MLNPPKRLHDSPVCCFDWLPDELRLIIVEWVAEDDHAFKLKDLDDRPLLRRGQWSCAMTCRWMRGMVDPRILKYLAWATSLKEDWVADHDEKVAGFLPEPENMLLQEKKHLMALSSSDDHTVIAIATNHVHTNITIMQSFKNPYIDMTYLVTYMMGCNGAIRSLFSRIMRFLVEKNREREVLGILPDGLDLVLKGAAINNQLNTCIFLYETFTSSYVKTRMRPENNKILRDAMLINVLKWGCYGGHHRIASWAQRMLDKNKIVYEWQPVFYEFLAKISRDRQYALQMFLEVTNFGSFDERCIDKIIKRGYDELSDWIIDDCGLEHIYSITYEKRCDDVLNN